MQGSLSTALTPDLLYLSYLFSYFSYILQKKTLTIDKCLPFQECCLYNCMLDFILSRWILDGKKVHIVHACGQGLVILYMSCLVRFDFIFFKFVKFPIVSSVYFYIVSVAIDCISKKILILL